MTHTHTNHMKKELITITFQAYSAILLKTGLANFVSSPTIGNSSRSMSLFMPCHVCRSGDEEKIIICFVGRGTQSCLHISAINIL